MALGFALGLITVTTFAGAQWRAMAGGAEVWRIMLATGFSCAFLLLGFVDDARPLSPKLKFAVFALLSVLAVMSVGVVTALPLGGGYSVPLGYWLGIFGSALFVFTLVNAVNFIDGCNGLAMGSVGIGLTALGIISLSHGAPAVAAVAFCGAGAMAGFLHWNFPKGKLFAGDSGALFAGSLAALGSLLAISSAGISPFVPPILFFPILADVLLTLAYRVSKRRKILAGHAEHMYQIFMRSWKNHAKVSRRFWVIVAMCGAIGIGASELEAWGGLYSYAPPAAFVGLAIVSLFVSAAVRSYARRKGLDSET